MMIDADIDIVVLNMPIWDTRKYKELEGVGQLVSDLVLTLLSWRVDEEEFGSRPHSVKGFKLQKKKECLPERKENIM